MRAVGNHDDAADIARDFGPIRNPQQMTQGHGDEDAQADCHATAPSVVPATAPHDAPTTVAASRGNPSLVVRRARDR